MLSLKNIQAAEKRIQKYLKPTPLLRFRKLEDELRYSGAICLKLDTEQPTGSFKVRGAFNTLLQLTPEEKKEGSSHVLKEILRKLSLDIFDDERPGFHRSEKHGGCKQHYIDMEGQSS